MLINNTAYYNTFKTFTQQNLQTITRDTKSNSDTTLNKLHLHKMWGSNTPFYKVLVIRGIGYRAFYIKNDFSAEPLIIQSTQLLHKKYATLYNEHPDIEEFDENYNGWNNLNFEFKHKRYLIIRAGHTNDLCLPLRKNVNVKISKKERKLTIYGVNKQEICDLFQRVYQYRRPSAYTGRGVRRKGIKVIRKAGKRDSKGR